jgi:GPH family glycoside/pentoside/hexuronide:cation symporter
MLQLATRHDDPDLKLGWGERIGFGMASCGRAMLSGVLGSFIMIYMMNVALLDAGILSILFAVSKLLDGISDIVVGNIVDHTRSGMGKARVWLLRMCLPMAISLFLIFNIPQGFSSTMKYIYVFVVYNLVNSVFMTFMQVPYFSMISLITRNSEERGFLGNIQQLFQSIGTIFINAFFIPLLSLFSDKIDNPNTQAGFTGAIIVIGVLVVVSTLITVIFTKERVRDDDNAKAKADDIKPLAAIKALIRNKYWVMMFFAVLFTFLIMIFMSASGTNYALYVLKDYSKFGLLANSISVSQLAVMILTPYLMKKMGKSLVFTIGTGLMTIGFLAFNFCESSLILIVLCNILKGVGLGMASGMSLGLVADALTYGQLKTGIDAVGMGNAGTSAAQKLGLGLGVAIFGWAIAKAGFDGSLTARGLSQPEAVISTIRAFYNGIPMILSIILFVAFVTTFRLDRDLKNLRKGKDE